MLDINNLDESKSGIKNNVIISDMVWSKSQKLYVNIVKPVLDIFFAVIGLILLLPLFLVISLAIKLDSRGPVFFRQERVGKDCKIFTLMKFRSMKITENIKFNPNEDKKRITRIGYILRKTSLDELPQLLNILIGNMSFIGPRPLLVDYLPFYSNNQIKRHFVKQGITGLAQISGRNEIKWKYKFALDIKYINDINLFLDLKIFYFTVLKVFKSEGISQKGKATVDYFIGNKI
jgi:undecaprenyl phosphate N,N'-diacetylbacillosamine 1-phosphate transferase